MPWGAFPDAVILVSESVAKGLPEYAKAKSGDAGAARALVNELVAAEGID